MARRHIRVVGAMLQNAEGLMGTHKDSPKSSHHRRA